MIIRGASVVVVPVLWPDDDSEPYTLMVRQHRPINADYTREFLGGILVPEESVEKCAVREVYEELGLTIARGELESASVNHVYLKKGKLNVKVMGMVWPGY